MTNEELDDLPLADEAKPEASSKAVRRLLPSPRDTRRSNYLHRAVLRVLAMSKEERAFIPISSIKEAVDEGALPVRYGDLVQLVRQLSDENQRLKAENEHLWKVAENPKFPTRDRPSTNSGC